jgi:hypothetical protein
MHLPTCSSTDTIDDCFSLRDGALRLIEVVNFAIGEVLEVLTAVGASKVLEVLLDLAAVAL